MSKSRVPLSMSRMVSCSILNKTPPLNLSHPPIPPTPQTRRFFFNSAGSNSTRTIIQTLSAEREREKHIAEARRRNFSKVAGKCGWDCSNQNDLKKLNKNADETLKNTKRFNELTKRGLAYEKAYNVVLGCFIAFYGFTIASRFAS